MDRTFNRAADYQEAQEWDIKQQINMTPEQRQKIARELKRRFYGENPPDVKDKRK
jgi:hypothetical protein